MSRQRNQLVALFFISLLVGHEASIMRRNILLSTLIFSVENARVRMEETLRKSGLESFVFKNMDNVSDQFTTDDGNPLNDLLKPKSCDNDILVDLSDGIWVEPQASQFRIASDQYRDLGKDGLVIAIKGTRGLSCHEFYAIKCIDNVVNWEHQKVGCYSVGLNLSSRTGFGFQDADRVTTTRFDSAMNTYQTLSKTGNERILGGRYVQEFPEWVAKVTVTPEKMSCPQLENVAAAAEEELTHALSDLCREKGDASKAEGSCFMQPDSMPPLDKFAMLVHSFMGANKAVKDAGCEKRSLEIRVKTSPSISAVKSLYSKMQSNKMNKETATQTIDEVIKSLIQLKRMPSDHETSDLLGRLFGVGHARGGNSTILEELKDENVKNEMASELWSSPDSVDEAMEAAKRSGGASLLELSTEVNPVWITVGVILGSVGVALSFVLGVVLVLIILLIAFAIAVAVAVIIVFALTVLALICGGTSGCGRRR